MEEQLRQVLIRLAVIEATSSRLDTDMKAELAGIRAKLDSILAMIGQDFVRKEIFDERLKVFDTRLKPIERMAAWVVIGTMGLVGSAIGYLIWPR